MQIHFSGKSQGKNMNWQVETDIEWLPMFFLICLLDINKSPAHIKMSLNCTSRLLKCKNSNHNAVTEFRLNVTAFIHELKGCCLLTPSHFTSVAKRPLKFSLFFFSIQPIWQRNKINTEKAIVACRPTQKQTPQQQSLTDFISHC